ncbi:MAG TPA: TadE family protein [Janthinobacterium sp.]|jgi:hypothetical protein|nr:TadE family protein [Janthinobacterium sp.]
MRATEAASPRRPPAQRGGFTVEFALAILLFLTLICLVLEVTRMLYLWNTVQEVTRQAARGASVSDFSSAAAMDRVRRRAIFRDTAGKLALGGDIDDSYVRIDYLSLDNGGQLQPVAVLPDCPMQNLVNCINDPNGASCVRFVRARMCVPGAAADGCQPVPYQPLTPLLAGLFALGGAAVSLPTSDTVVVAESLGYVAGTASCP